MPKTHNILIFQTDQQRWDVTEPHHPCKTPNLDRMAAEGVRFRTVLPPMAHCCPSRASFMTGLYPSQHGVWNNTHNHPALSRGLKRGVECWSEKARANGYTLRYSGKWHVSADEDPRDRGWTEGYLTAAKVPAGEFAMGHSLKQWQNHEIVDTPLDQRQPGQIIKPGWGDWWIYGTREDRYPGYVAAQNQPWDDGHGDCAILSSALSQLDEALASDTPWIHYIGFNGPHDPFIVPERYLAQYDPAKIELPENWNDPLLDKPAYFRRQKMRFDQMSEHEKRECIAHYYAYCTMVDDMFGEVLHKLENAGQLDDTTVIFCSDHGEFLGEHGLYCKGVAPYDGGYRVPLFVRAPRWIRNPGRSVDALVSLMDLCPTIVDLSGCQAPNGGRGPGRSLLPWLRDEVPSDWRDALLLQCNGTEVYFSSRTVRTSAWKFVYNPVDFDELYDLQNDPNERVNLARDPRYSATLRELYVRMWELATEADDDWIASEYHTVSLADFGPKAKD